jgi:hypothetical protein
MAGTITVSTISDGTNSTSSTNCIQGSAKAWVNFVGSSGSINSSYNVSSVTRSAAGTYAVNFTTAFSDAKYVYFITGQRDSTTSKGIVGQGYGTQTTSALNIYTYDLSASLLDWFQTNISVFR